MYRNIQNTCLSLNNQTAYQKLQRDMATVTHLMKKFQHVLLQFPLTIWHILLHPWNPPKHFHRLVWQDGGRIPNPNGRTLNLLVLTPETFDLPVAPMEPSFAWISFRAAASFLAECAMTIITAMDARNNVFCIFIWNFKRWIVQNRW